MNGAERQEKFRRKQRESGKERFEVWVSHKERIAILKLLAKMRAKK